MLQAHTRGRTARQASAAQDDSGTAMRDASMPGQDADPGGRASDEEAQQDGEAALTAVKTC